MSAYGYERTFGRAVIFVCFTPESGRSCQQPSESACDPKRTDEQKMTEPWFASIIRNMQ